MWAKLLGHKLDLLFHYIKQLFNRGLLYQNPYLSGTPKPKVSQKRQIDFDYGNGVSKTRVYGTVN